MFLLCICAMCGMISWDIKETKPVLFYETAVVQFHEKTQWYHYNKTWMKSTTSLYVANPWLIISVLGCATWKSLCNENRRDVDDNDDQNLSIRISCSHFKFQCNQRPSIHFQSSVYNCWCKSLYRTLTAKQMRELFVENWSTRRVLSVFHQFDGGETQLFRRVLEMAPDSRKICTPLYAITVIAVHTSSLVLIFVLEDFSMG